MQRTEKRARELDVVEERAAAGKADFLTKMGKEAFMKEDDQGDMAKRLKTARNHVQKGYGSESFR